ncbi:GntR family transcriptional regulator [Ketogulonicigenium vulgare]|uniref:GntR-family transcription regulator, putative n=1 Tax=Ketogulonicigenium vulgare (strain WSH-001) TaxID=759362 RepID=F9Y908_KETVW|nr:FCD domain-containing protein [Ketogulonicigenium vulgare]ADO41838.1 transcriptional regulator (activator) protein [Ketogulonicigenium vulgare Y25]AEM40064.1 GntR-family transcription regulator, putative [Ketogulonicigenium vulgare WSH-001]ALJ80267.1 AsnC family transcriptional regulator [Ketogulonicigenium vulgare]ANW33123.1 AsnC family transcriptional regulator [Ketogulonicigenium vulgare]AOZ53762.1 transcriptional regulator (activator) protein [Ketogulonicigenium vulgare]
MRDSDSKITTSEDICLNIERIIASGELEDGARLDENRLAQMFGVSRTPVREAFRLLAAQGLVTIHRNRGAFARIPDFMEMVEMFDVMAGMEAWCGRLAATRISNAALIMLGASADRCETLQQAHDIAGYYDENEVFHQLIYNASGNAFLAQETTKLQRRLKPYRQLQLGYGDRLEQSLREHREILAAITARDADRAAAALHDHIRIQHAVYNAYRDEMRRKADQQHK